MLELLCEFVVIFYGVKFFFGGNLIGCLILIIFNYILDLLVWFWVMIVVVCFIVLYDEFVGLFMFVLEVVSIVSVFGEFLKYLEEME